MYIQHTVQGKRGFIREIVTIDQFALFTPTEIAHHIVPRVDGIEIAAALRRRGIDCPGILLAADGHAALRRRAGSARLTVVEKPIVDNILTETIRAAIDNSN